MLGEFRVAIYVAAAGSAAAALAFSMPPLTQDTSAEPASAALRTAVSQERAFCEAEGDVEDCKCFGDVAGYVRNGATDYGRGIAQADPLTLARSQAQASC